MKFRIIIITCIIFLLNGCLVEPEKSNIPNASVNFYIDVSLSGTDNYLADGLLGNSKIYTQSRPSKLSPNGSYGYSGVVVVRAYDNNLYAFDICCTYESNKDIALKNDGFFLKCQKCSSTFEIGNGTGVPNSGPASVSLKKYHTSQNSSQKVRIYN
jgi:nitrite reductase/ring-hydroxylating ferredoxin subunit